MPARVEYVTTADGVRIAYAAHGRGQAIISMPPMPFRHIELEWTMPEDRRWLEWVASKYRLVQYDPRGLGLSDRTATEYSAGALERDLDAVVTRVAPAGATLFAAVNSGPLAIAYAAHHPERVSHLILWCASSRGAEGIGHQLDALLALVDHDWELTTETAAHVLRGWSAGEPARRFAATLRESASPDAFRALARLARDTDVTALLAAIRSPTLVLHRRGVTWIPIERAVELASGIPGAQLVMLEGDSMAPWTGDMGAVGRAVDEFLGTPATDAVETPRGAGDLADAFRREGEYWTLAFEGRLCRLQDAKGLHHIAYLLRRPGEHVAALDLVAALEGGPSLPASDAGDAPRAGSLGDAGPMLDAYAKDSYRKRRASLRDELADAERCNDVGRAAAIRAEIEFIEDELAAAVGLGGRDRKVASSSERARVTVTKRIKDALARIRREHAALGEHLDRTVKTGVLCAYLPPADRRTPWSL